jgi:hypothetical protein
LIFDDHPASWRLVGSRLDLELYNITPRRTNGWSVAACLLFVLVLSAAIIGWLLL